MENGICVAVNLSCLQMLEYAELLTRAGTRAQDVNTGRGLEMHLLIAPPPRQAATDTRILCQYHLLSWSTISCF